MNLENKSKPILVYLILWLNKASFMNEYEPGLCLTGKKEKKRKSLKQSCFFLI
jgi:hypothetical protein